MTTLDTGPGPASADAPGPPSPSPGWLGAGRRRIVWLAVSLAAVIAVGVALVATAGGPANPPMRPFHLESLSGGPPVTYPPSGSGPVAMTFFASWCTACRTDLPVFASIASADERAGSPVRFIGIDGNDTSKAAGLAFARQQGVTFPVGWDYYESVASQLDLAGLPDTVFIDRDGHVVHVIQGDSPSEFNRATLQHWVRQIASS